MLCLRAAAQTFGDALPGERLRRAWTRALRKMAKSAPEVPSMVFSTMETMVPTSITASPVRPFSVRCLRIAE
jgi:hypothetical protein